MSISTLSQADAQWGGFFKRIGDKMADKLDDFDIDKFTDNLDDFGDVVGGDFGAKIS